MNGPTNLGEPHATGSDEGLYKIPALRVLSEITSTLSTDTGLEDLLRRFLSTMIRLAGASAGAVRVLTADGASMRLIGSLNLPPDVVERERVTPADCGACGRALCAHAVQCSTSVFACQEHTHSDYFGESCRQVIAVPLRHKGKIMGVYNLFMETEAPISQDVSLLFYSISEHLGIALENARLTRENIRITLMNERQMLANEIHDSLAQTLAYMKMRLGLLRTAINMKDPLHTERYLNDVDEAAESSYAVLRDLLTQFRHRMDPRGLAPALDELLARLCEKTGIQVEFANRCPELTLTPDQEVQVFHIVQEALANISKHAKAKHVAVTIERSTPERVSVTVTDDGVGIDGTPRAPDTHLGINIMHERAERLHGEIDFESRPGEGTVVRLSFPAPAQFTGRHG
ncbi:MAG: histidine kinase [Betaproteobacteria bacterium]|nr:histidine kinase [Betaproteobacteria bacterium]